MAAICRHTLPGVYDDATIEWAAQGPSVKVADARAIPTAMRVCPDVFYRPCFLQGDNGEGDCADGLAWANLVIREVATKGGVWPHAIGYRNEMNATVANVQQYQRYRARLKQAGFGGKVVFGSFGVGRPDWPEWGPMVAAFGANPPDEIEVHEYYSLTTEWARANDVVLRINTVYSRGLIPTTWKARVGEHGSDDVGVAGVYEDAQRRRGWNDRNKLRADQFATALGIFSLLWPPQVSYAYVFADGSNGDPQWTCYNTKGQAVIEGAERNTWPSVPRPGDRSVRLGLPLENQLDPVQDPSPNMSDNCGPATANCIAHWLGAIPANEDIAVTLAQETGDPNWIGYTYTNQMADWFTKLLGVPAIQTQPTDMLGAMQDAVDAGYSFAYLRYFDEQKRTGGHFEPCDGYTINYQGDRSWWLMNPWGGVWENLTDQEVLDLSLGGWLVVVQQGRKVVVEDPVITTARNKARMANPNIQFNESGALFTSWVRKVRAWINSGQDNAVDPGYWVVSETVVGAAPARMAGTMLSDGGILLAYENKGWTAFMAEQKDRANLIKTFGWSLA